MWEGVRRKSLLASGNLEPIACRMGLFHAYSSPLRSYATTAANRIGLPTVKQIVEQHGGRIEVASTVGSGTRVVVRLPLPQTQEIAA